MDKEIAMSLIHLGKSMDEILAKMYIEVDKISDEQVKARFNRAVGDLMGSIARDLIFPIENKYPDLNKKHT